MILVVLGLLIAGGIGDAGYYIGGGFDDEYDEGFRAGREEGYDAGYSSGESAGIRQGEEQAKPAFTYNQGLRDGRVQGRQEGYEDGANDALSLEQFSPQTGVLYITEFRQGGGNLPYFVKSTLKMNPTEEYVAQGTNVLSGPKD